MRKKDLATANYRLRELSQAKEHSDNLLMEIIGSAFSALATSEPAIALEVIEQIVSQKQAIVDLENERAEQESAWVKNAVKNMVGYLEFDQD